MSRGFNKMPEVRKVLDDHLDPERDPSPAIRAVYGHWLPWLEAIDQGWASLNWRAIYPADEGQRRLWSAAWEAYIRFVAPYDNVLELLHDVYARAVESLGEESPNGTRHPEKPSERLAHHLMIFYGRGKLDLDEPDGLLAKFYERAPDVLRAQAFWLVGRDFQQMNIPVPLEVLERIQRLCERRIQIARSSNSPGDYRTEMKTVGWLFASLKFDDAWALAQLRNAIEVSGWADPDYKVVEHLAALAPEHPALTVECLGMMIDGAKDRWGIRYWSQHARTILAAALRSDDSARQTAVALINRLGARGFLEFKDLLDP